MRSQGAYFEEDLSIIVLCTMFLVSYIFFNKCLYLLIVHGWILSGQISYGYQNLGDKGGVCLRITESLNHSGRFSPDWHRFSDLGLYTLFKAALLKYNSHTTQFTYLKCTVQWMLI